MTARRRRLILIAVLTAMAALTGLASAAQATTTITFDDGTTGALKDQYAAQGVRFQTTAITGSPEDAAGVMEVGADKAHSGTKVAGRDNCQGEICEHLRYTAQFTELHKAVELYVGTETGLAEVRVTAYGTTFVNGKRKVIDSETVTTNPGSVTKLVQLTSTKFDIAFLEIDDVNVESRSGLAFDSLSYDDGDPASQPDISLSTPDLNSEGWIGIRPNQTRKIDIDVTRFGGASGSLSFTVQDAPALIEETVAPASSAGDAVELSIRTRASATDENVIVRVTATPSSVNAGSEPRTLEIPVHIERAFDLAMDPVKLDACGRGTRPVSVYAPEPFRIPLADPWDGTIDLFGGNLPDGTHVNVQPGSVDWPGAEDRTAMVGLIVPPGTTSTTAEIVARQEPYADARLQIPIQAAPAITVTGISSMTGRTPRALTEGTEVMILGTNLCSGLTVFFGNALASAPTTDAAADGTWIKVRVPRLATSGQVRIVGGTQQAVVPGTFKVSSYRNTQGFSFQNYPLHDLEFAHTTWLYGKADTYISACIPFTDECWSTPIGDPTALAYHATMDGWLSGDPGDAHCFGMSYFINTFGAATVGHPELAKRGLSALNVFELDSSTGKGPKSSGLDFMLKGSHIAQLSIEGMQEFASEFSENLFANAHNIRTQVRDILKSGQFPYISIQDDGGHVMTIYDLEESSEPGVEFYLRVYDSNRPHLASEELASFDPLSDPSSGAFHRDKEQLSRVKVTATGWKYPASNREWSGSFSEMAVVDPDEIPFRPSIPSLADLLEGAMAIFGSDTETETITDAGGDMTKPRGNQLQRAQRMYVQDSGAPPVNFHWVRGGGPFTQVIRSKSGKPYSGGFVGGGFTARVLDVQSDGKESDTFEVDQARRTLAFSTAAPNRRLTLSLASATGGKSAKREVRTVKLATTATRDRQSSVSLRGGDVTYEHAGEAATVSMEIGWVGPRGTPGTFKTPPIEVAGGETLELDPRNWRDLGRTRATLVSKRAGKTRRRTLRNRTGKLRVLGATKVAAKKTGKTRRLVLTTRLGAVPDGSTVGGGITVRRGGKRILRKRISDLALSKGRNVVFDGAVKGLKPGRYKVTVAIGVLAAGEQPRVQTKRFTRRLRVR